MILSYRKTINDSLSRMQHLQADTRSLRQELEDLQKDKVEITELLSISRKAAGIVQDAMCAKLSHIVTRVLKTVIADDIEFVIEFVERRGVHEADMFIRDKDGHEYDILDSRGGGLADVVSLALQMSFIMLSDVDRYLILDEPSRHLSMDAQERLGEVLKMLCKEFNFTMLFVTHSKALTEIADKVFHVELKDGRSYVTS